MFLARWSIRRKLRVCLAIVLGIVGALAYSGFAGAYSYRELARTISVRARELPLAGEVSKSLGDLRVTLSKAQQAHAFATDTQLSGVEQKVLSDEYRERLLAVQEALRCYRKQLNAEVPTATRLGDRTHELKTIGGLERDLTRLLKTKEDQQWLVEDSRVAAIADDVEHMYDEAGTLPQKLHTRMHDFAHDVKSEYRTWIFLEWTATIAGSIFLPVVIYLFYDWLFRPLGILIAGSRRIARQDDFAHRIRLKGGDEMAELAGALNDMTARFQEIRSDLDAQVKQRTKEVVRSEQLASVGFLAAGVAHEINNPLASIAWCAESLDSRLHETLAEDNEAPAALLPEDAQIVRKYLQRIQDEAFRCKGITEKLLDFSRLGDVEKHETDLGELVQGVIEMVRHLGNYRQKKIDFECPARVVLPVNAQEIKQVVLNLITNALDSLGADGTVWIALRTSGPWAELVVRDNGCGMTEEVLQHLFEPFFTRRRDGSGTGLGLSITYRIVTDHGGTIEPASAGAGQGAQMRLLLPLAANKQEQWARAA